MDAQRNAWANWVVCYSNLAFGIPALWWAPGATERALILAAVIASSLMHISETKHKLPGVAPFRRLSAEFLWLDRGMVLIAAGYYAHKMLSHGLPIPWFPLTVGSFCLFLSEWMEYGPLWFAVTHCAWHACAYMIMCL